MVKTKCPNCNSEKEIKNVKTQTEGKATTHEGICETCGQPLRLIQLDMQKKV